MKSDDRALSCPCRALPSREPARGTNRSANKHGARILRISPPRKKGTRLGTLFEWWSGKNLMRIFIR